jgi:hypothetical protein
LAPGVLTKKCPENFYDKATHTKKNEEERNQLCEYEPPRSKNTSYIFYKFV